MFSHIPLLVIPNKHIFVKLFFCKEHSWSALSNCVALGYIHTKLECCIYNVLTIGCSSFNWKFTESVSVSTVYCVYLQVVQAHHVIGVSENGPAVFPHKEQKYGLHHHDLSVQFQYMGIEWCV